MSELIAALNQLEKEKGIDKDVIMEAIENSLLAACKRDFGSADKPRNWQTEQKNLTRTESRRSKKL